MVRDAALELQGSAPPLPLNPEIEFPADAYLPEAYVEDALQRTTLYQKIARLPDRDAVAGMESELLDRFGPLPTEALMLLRTVEARLACRTLGVQKAEVKGNQLVLTFSNAHLPAREELTAMAARIVFPFRFLYGEPLQLSVNLNPPRRGDVVALTDMATEVLRGMAKP